MVFIVFLPTGVVMLLFIQILCLWAVSEGQAGQFREFGSCQRCHSAADALPALCYATRLS